MNMDFSESTRIVISRIQKLEPKNATKVVAYIMLQENAERELLRLAFGPDNLIQSSIDKAKLYWGLTSDSHPISPTPINTSDLHAPFTPFSPNSASSHPRVPLSPYWDAPQIALPHPDHPHQAPMNSIDFVPPQYQDLPREDYHLHNQAPYYPAEAELSPHAGRRSLTLPEFPGKACMYYYKGFCKHGDNCQFFHGRDMPDNFAPSELFNDDQLFLHGSLEKLEMEIAELLKARRGVPISIASLPILYYEMYGKTIQAEGYLTESQRHGKPGFSLTKLLARLNNSIRLIDKPHGQHSVVLAEDAPRFMSFRSERNDPCAASKQIYLTFPPDSTFTEEDVSNYFSSFGPVQDVRIPCQQKRMYGFVTFEYPETAKMILEQGRPHFVCGARVLVKKYMEKSKLDRKNMEKIEASLYYPHYLDMASELSPMPRISDGPRFIRKHYFEENEQALEFQRMRLAELQLLSRQQAQQSFFGQTSPVEELKLTEGRHEVPSSNGYDYISDAINSGTANDDKHTSSNFHEQDSTEAVNLPESPFASPMRSRTTVM
ncbi:Zinc finger CCCH domain-containing protein 18 [Acorus calamus]|uniref:Zinc finger CCCH domain-containing protein 18 n=1 Tax=Acorus calamus TaxID=4465 RepID=A0AAV9D7P5_ACOCL|nr:Zinc finger CCCH domain-containing protein 18 [Acorus calamus]